MKKINYRLFGVISIIFLCIGFTFKYFQNDTFYIIKLGEFISNNGIDFVDHYSWVADLAYTYPHWLYDVLIYIIYNNYGYLGIYVSTIIFFIVLVLSFYFVNIKMHKNEFLAIFVSIVTVFRLSMFAVARSQIISLTLFMLEVYWINKLIETGKKRYIWLLGLGSLLIANVHATVWLFYFVLFLPFLGEYFVSILIERKFIKKFYKINYNIDNSKIVVEKFSNLKYLIISFVISFLMGLLSPSKICYSYVFRTMLGNSQNVLLEHLPLIVIEQPYFLVMILILLLVMIFTDTKIYLRELLMVGGIIFMSLISTRHLCFFFTIGVIYIVVICYRCLCDKNDKTLDILGKILVGNKFVMFSCLVLIFGVSLFNFYKHSKEDYVLKEEYPVFSVKYIRDNLDYENIRLYNGYNYGSYLLFKDIPVFIDSRCDLYLKEFNGMDYSIFDEMEDIGLEYENIFKEYDVTHVLVAKSEELYPIISKDSNYDVLYEDDDFVLYDRLDDGV